MRDHRLFYISLGILALAITLTQVTAYYYSQRLDSNVPGSGCAVSVCTLVNFGNSTSTWHNETVPSEWNFYNVTVHITSGNIQAVYYPAPLNEHFVTAIDGIRNSGQYSWTIWSYCSRHNAWLFSSIGADRIKLSNGATLAWVYEIPNSHSPPIAGSATVDTCS